MDTGRIKQFATESRRILKEGVMQRIRALGFDSEGNTPDMPERVQGGTRYQGRLIENERFYDCWVALNKRIHELGRNGVQQVYEEAAYTWFNRLVAIRIMQKNDFIEPVLSYDVADIRVPHIVSEARKGRLMVSLTDEEDRRLRMLLMDDTKTQEQFALLITAYCRETPFISKCFGGIDLYLELLLPDDILSANRFIDLLNHTDEYITDEQFRSAELIGWLYQFYISERKDEVFASFKKGKKAEAEDIPAATQIFTPNWIVKYMVQNTVGRIYLDNNPYCPLKKDWRYLVEPIEPTPKDAILKIDDLEELTLADLACGSGHILVEGFDLFYGLYIDEGYSRHDAVVKILTKNLTGVDLDTRAKQLATFALLLKAAQIDKSFLDGKVMPRVLDMPNVDRYTWRDLDGHMATALRPTGGTEEIAKEIEECFVLMEQAHNLGSIMKFDISAETRAYIKQCVELQKQKQKFVETFSDLFHGFELILSLTKEHSAVVMNPPYFPRKNMNSSLNDYVQSHYPNGMNDLFATFMFVGVEHLQKNGKMGMINMQNWMFITTFKSTRISFVEGYQIDNLLHLGTRTFDELSGDVVQNAAFVVSNHIPTRSGVYYKLTEGKCCADKERDFLHESEVYRDVNQKEFDRLPDNPLAYWVTEKIASTFTRNKALSAVANPWVGLQTADNALFLRSWFEVNKGHMGIGIENAASAARSGKKWFPYNKGGRQRRWYGNQELLINWEFNGKDIKNYPGAVIRNEHTYFRHSISWGLIAGPLFRYYPDGFLYDVQGMSCFFDDDTLLFTQLAWLNTKVFKEASTAICPTGHIQIGEIGKLPSYKDTTKGFSNVAKENISISKQDWDSHETSWDFAQNELLSITENTFLDIIDDYADFHGLCIDPAAPQPESLEWRYDMYKTKWETKFMRLHQNEEELNRQFISIYGLEDELTPDVPLDEITILQQGEISIENDEVTFHADVVMKQLISYAIGCMMGRYRLDKPGLHIAYPNPTDEDIAPYEFNGTEFHIDEDAIIPLMPKDTRFDDNAVNRLVDFIKQVLGAEKLTDNLNFIEKQLGKSLEQYLVKDFWKDHKKMYQNRPIYWLFSSKKGAFQVIAYMHRMDKYTVENIRNKYLLPHIEFLRQEIAELDSRASTLNPQERKTYVRLQKELEECQEYHDRLHTVADQQIAFDLDDGVVVNYAKFGDVVAKLK